MSTQTIRVQGMTCGHCTKAVTDEITALGGVTDVVIDLVPGEVSHVVITSDAPLSAEQLAAAVDEAGYSIVA